MSPLRKSIVLATLMSCAAVASVLGRPGEKAGPAAPPYVLEEVVPEQFGEWTLVRQPSVVLVNPQTQQLLDKLYSQLLNRTYVNRDGYRVMLAMAYGDDQRGALQAHMPEVCYPAQGFKVHSESDHGLGTPYGAIPVRRLHTQLATRVEPVTYWFNLGDEAMAGSNRFQRRLVEIRFGLTGQVPDGLLIRVSSIDAEVDRAYEVHEAFVRDLLKALSPELRQRLVGV